MKTILPLLTLLVTLTGHARTTIFDYIQEGKGEKVGVTEACGKELKKLKRSRFYSKDIEAQIQPLEDLQVGVHFFHYTNASVLNGILQGSMKDRAAAHEEIIKTGGYKSIMEHSFQTVGDGNIRGAGFYMAGNPFTSRIYGRYQIRMNLNPATKVLVNYENTYLPAVNELRQSLGNRILRSCSYEILHLLIYQESGVDLYAYSDTNEWYVLINEDIIDETIIMDAGDESAISALAKVGRVREALGGDKSVKSFFPGWLKAEKDQTVLKNVFEEARKNTDLQLLSHLEEVTYWKIGTARFESYKELLLKDDPEDSAFVEAIKPKLCVHDVYKKTTTLAHILETSAEAEKVILQEKTAGLCP